MKLIDQEPADPQIEQIVMIHECSPWEPKKKKKGS